MELKDAIEISRIISKAPEERLPMILSVLEKADVNIGGLDDLEEWKAYKDMSAVIDLGEFMEFFEKKFKDKLDGGRYRIPTGEFSEFCRERKLKPTPVRRLLARKEIIETCTEGSKTSYTIPVNMDGKRLRCVVVKEDWKKEVTDSEKEKDEAEA